MIREYTDYVLAKRRHAIFATVFFSIIPLFNLLAYVTLNLVTLQRGARSGAELLLALTLANVSLALFGYSMGLNTELSQTLEMILYFNFCSFAAAWLLREYKSWFLTIECACYLGLVIILITHVIYPDLETYWLETLQQQVKIVSSLFGDSQTLTTDTSALKALASNATGLRALTIICSILFYLFVARWFQTRRFSPGQLRKELLLLRADTVSLVIVGIVMLGSYFDFKTAQDMHSVAILPMVLTGLSLVHNFASLRKHWFLLIMSFYLVFCLFPTQVFGMLIFLTILDLFYDLRGKYDGYNITGTH